MAAIGAIDLEDLRRRAASAHPPHWTKAQVNAGLQAIEDAMTAGNVGPKTVKTYIGQAIEAAAPTIFSAGEKDDLFVLWSLLNARRGGIL